MTMNEKKYVLTAINRLTRMREPICSPHTFFVIAGMKERMARYPTKWRAYLNVRIDEYKD